MKIIQILFDKKIETVNQIVDFIEAANSKGESCLVHSVRGQSRSCCALTAYFMRRYQWTLLKTLDFLNSRRPDLEIRATFFDQLKSLEAYLQQTGQGAISQDWTQSGKGSEAKILVESSPEEILLRNTYLNSKQGQIPDYYLNIGKPQRFGGYSPYKKPVPTKIIWQDEASNNKKKLVQVLNQNQSSSKKGTSVQHRKPSPAPFKRTHAQNQQQQVKQAQQLQTDFPKQQEYYDSILKGSNKTFKKGSGEEVAEDELSQFKYQDKSQQQIQYQQNGPSNLASYQRSNENSTNKPINGQNKINSYRDQEEQDLENNDTNLIYKSLANKENTSRPGSTRDDSLLQDKNGNDQNYKNQQEIQNNQVKGVINRNSDTDNQQNQKINNQIYNNNGVTNNISSVRRDNNQQNFQNSNVKNKYNNDNISKVNNINGNIINLTVNNFVNATVGTPNPINQGFQIANPTGNIIGNASIPVNYDINVDPNLGGQPYVVSYPQTGSGLDYSVLNNSTNNGSFIKSNNFNGIDNNSSLLNSNQLSAGKQQKQMQSSDPKDKKKVGNQVVDLKQSQQVQQIPISQQMVLQNQQAFLIQKQQQHQQQLTNSQIQQLEQQQQQNYSFQPNPLQILQNKQPQFNSQNQTVSNSQTLSKMLSKNNTYQQQDPTYSKAVSKSFNQSKVKQDMVFTSNQYPIAKDLNSYSLIKNDLSDSKITKNMMKQKQNLQNSQLQQQPVSHKYPIKANPDIFEKRPNSANNSLPQGRQAFNGFVVMTNNFLMGNNTSGSSNNNFNENENNMLDSSNINKRPSSSGGGLRSFSPGSKAIKQQNLPNNLKPQMIVKSQNGKKTGMRYPSPIINSQNQNSQLMSASQKNKWK